MWWYYKCVNLIKVLIQGSKVILFSIENALQENHGHGWSSAPYGQSDSISRRWAASKPDSWKDEARSRARSSLPSCNSRALLNSARSNARKADLEAGPPDSLSTKPTIGGGLRPCQSRNGATKSTIAGESFPRWRHAAISSLHTRTTEGARAEHVTPETKNWTHAGKRNNSEPALNPSKQVQTEFLILIELVKIRSECSNETYVFVRDLLAGWLSYEIVKNVIL